MRRIAAMVVTAGLVLAASACGGSKGAHVAQLGSTMTQGGASTSAASQENGALAFARCMRSHGIPDFPDPDSQGHFPSFHTDVPKRTSVAANGACKHLLSRGASTGTPQQRQQKFALALKAAACLRGHGFPDFPDPTPSGQRVPPKIDTDSPQFQAAETNCEKQARKALGLP